MQEESRYLKALQKELVPALGCTEPIAIAFASAKAREVLGTFPQKLDVWCSGNIVKNVKAVIVPNSGGLKGIDAAAILGAVGGCAGDELEVLQHVTQEDRARTMELLAQPFCTCHLAEGEDKLYVKVCASAGDQRACVVVEQHHTNITYLSKNDTVLYKNESSRSAAHRRWGEMSVRGILEFADTVELEQIRPLLETQMNYNCAISAEGMKTAYGPQVWRSITEINGDGVFAKAMANAAAASEARMCGCPLPVIINSGSGNQGITVSVPVVTIARANQIPEQKLIRALAVSNLISIHIKSYIGDLSAFCGAVTASCGAGAAIAYMFDMGYDVVCNTISNTLASVSGIVCDGAKASCAAKIAASLEAAFSGYRMAVAGRAFEAGDGIVARDIEETIRSVGHIGRNGMDITDREILKLMLENK